MKMIQALKTLKQLLIRVKNNERRLLTQCQQMSREPLPGDPKKEVATLHQGIRDTLREFERLSAMIQFSNASTYLTIDIPGGGEVRKTVSEWLSRRQRTLEIDAAVYQQLASKLQSLHPDTIVVEGDTVLNSPETNYDAEEYSVRRGNLEEERLAIDAALEIHNAVTDLKDLPDDVQSS